MRAVIDTGVLVSALIKPSGTTGMVLQMLREGTFTPVYSIDILVEIVDVLGKVKFREKYHIRPEDILALVQLIRLRGELVIPTEKIAACRDPKDDKFLEAALAGGAEVIVSGDHDLLDLRSYAGINLMSPAAFLTQLSEE